MHFKRNHDLSTDSLIRCCDCTQTFQNLNSCKRHVNRHHNSNDRPNEISPSRCNDADARQFASSSIDATVPSSSNKIHPSSKEFSYHPVDAKLINSNPTSKPVFELGLRQIHYFYVVNSFSAAKITFQEKMYGISSKCICCYTVTRHYGI